jgi:HptB-dependent secretion and biofilm anti anti-sigma factor
MHAQTTLSDNTFEARLTDRLSFADNSAFRKLLDDAVASKRRNMILNLEGLTSVDSAGLGMFIIAAETAKKAGLSLTLRSPSGHVRKLIELSKMDKLLSIEF